jgi:transcriptional regulator with XRE-family HTH domain
MSQRDLAEKAQVTPGYIAQLETGLRKNPSLTVLRRLARVLGVRPTDLLQQSGSAGSFGRLKMIWTSVPPQSTHDGLQRERKPKRRRAPRVTGSSPGIGAVAVT